ncbi:MAG: bifunctional nuclease family protein [bacterium]
MRVQILAMGLWLLVSLLAASSYPAAVARGAEAPRVPVQIKRVLLINDSPAVLLVDPEEKSFLLVFIDFFMANAIQMGMEPPELERPLTHDLITIFLQTLGAKVTRIDITELKNNTYYALITLQVNGRSRQIDSRPSDALAIAVRQKTPIFVNGGLMKILKNAPQKELPGETPHPAERRKPRAST